MAINRALIPGPFRRDMGEILSDISVHLNRET